METIKINEIVKMQTKAGKDFWVVKYCMCVPDAPTASKIELEATIGQWHTQLADYIEKDVGIGGTVSVLIEQKGEYTNITKVDMKSAVKGQVYATTDGSNQDHLAGIAENPKPDTMMYSDKDKSIIAQCLTKVFCRNMSLITTEPEFVLDAYNYFLGEL